MNNTIELFCPFDGFAYTDHGEDIERCVEDELEQCLGAAPDAALRSSERRRSDDLDYRAAQRLYAKAFVEKLGEEIELESLTFKEVVSPREYNFENDRLRVTMTRKDSITMLGRVDWHALTELVKVKCQTRDGFFSFYPSNIKLWPHFDDWDVNHLFYCLTVLCDTELGEGWQYKFDLLTNEIIQELL